MTTEEQALSDFKALLLPAEERFSGLLIFNYCRYDEVTVTLNEGTKLVRVSCRNQVLKIFTDGSFAKADDCFDIAEPGFDPDKFTTRLFDFIQCVWMCSVERRIGSIANISNKMREIYMGTSVITSK